MPLFRYTARREEPVIVRDFTICTKLAQEEVDLLDRLRGSLTRAAFLRLLVIAAGKRNGA